MPQQRRRASLVWATGGVRRAFRHRPPWRKSGWEPYPNSPRHLVGAEGKATGSSPPQSSRVEGWREPVTSAAAGHAEWVYKVSLDGLWWFNLISTAVPFEFFPNKAITENNHLYSKLAVCLLQTAGPRTRRFKSPSGCTHYSGLGNKPQCT